ncbi:hypothetical protein D1610_06215 [Sphingomonas gilva]|uniref:Ancillary SecYEG translocon subunit/Cell division coordinator CpoB TPR domain-containing protein n=1 Tax=Sphingomonas gilva TaxID=2305907 RepID=A0A396RQ88_9SPHN|nr:tetratricopeptide repeat protein [Sphingomonas gilva]RHW18086.1 hypothetical protein D1610_06215 [Sphingomonas gilva]
MALTPQNNEAFLREVDEELRRDQLREFWTKRGILLIAVLAIALAAFGGWLYWQHHKTSQAAAQGERFSAALDDVGAGARDKAAPVFAELAKEGTPGYRAMAKMMQADLALERGELPAAAAIFGEIAADTTLPQPIRDLALIRQTAAQFDTLKPEQVIQRLKPLAVKGNPWLGSAGEMVAIAHLKLNQTREAGAIFQLIAQEEGVPDTLRSRAVQMAGVLGVDAVDQSEDKQAQ